MRVFLIVNYIIFLKILLRIFIRYGTFFKNIEKSHFFLEFFIHDF